MTNTTNAPIAELVSALVDGELLPHETSQALDHLQDNPAARADWEAYHVVGDVLRAQAMAQGDSASASGFAARFRERLQQEKAEQAQSQAQVEHQLAPTSVTTLASARLQTLNTAPDSANDAVFLWKMVAGLASVMAVAVMGWHWMAGGSGSGLGQQWASAEPAPQAIMIRDPRLDRLLAAHQQVSGISGGHMSNGFLRNATYTVSEP